VTFEVFTLRFQTDYNYVCLDCDPVFGLASYNMQGASREDVGTSR